MSPVSKFGLAIVAGTLALALAPQAVEAGTVVASSGPSASTYPVGTQVSDTQRISLRAGDSVTVLDGGRTRVLRGPGTFILAQRGGASSDNVALSALTTRRAASRARTGAVRGVDDGTPASNPNIFYVDVAVPGTVCLSNIDRVNLYRGGDRSQEAMYTIAPSGSPEEAVNVTFPANEMLARWDSALQLRDGATYTIGSEAEGEDVQVTFVQLTDVPEDNPEALAQAFISNGCTAQLSQIVAAAQTGG
ncbi:hypothetical protein OZN62_07685 [Aurantiacibacter sp. MUD11]|uniref:hypothetical protein n=1 Tax=Aurantiacibacter sp. MUD11 TaxID=3003265 RepID=UPI0022AA3A8F|nr:hypothetical protein [Aurantiacibacter sp. MUD11]WAT16827.1 hypothetical protein OZN62_07685 [Aurantiacibacter sp. MUD11]